MGRYALSPLLPPKDHYATVTDFFSPVLGALGASQRVQPGVEGPEGRAGALELAGRASSGVGGDTGVIMIR